MNQEEIKYLFKQRISGIDFSEEEQKRWNSLVNNESNQQQFEELLESLMISNTVQEGLSEETISLMLSRITDMPDGARETHPVVHRVHFLKTTWFKYAAAIIILFGIGAYLWNTKVTPLENARVETAKSDVAAPDKELATLTLSNGKTITLDTLSNGFLALEGQVKIQKLEDGRIIYNGISAGEMLYNTISVPRGSKIASLTLSDGTIVFLNSASSLKYPVAFNGNERNVEITGEAYFEVAKDPRRKFSVTGNGITTHVLGTSFNMNTYADEEYNRITLLEGSIRVSQYNESVVVEPGDQAIAGGKKIQINQSVDLSKVIAWKNGLFNFEGMGVKEVMQQLSRWYDIDIIYQGQIPDVEFIGKISRNVSLSGILKALEGNGVRYKMENSRKLIILP